MSLYVGSAIAEILLSSKSVKDNVGDRIFPILSKKDTKYPFIVYKRSGLVPAYTKDKYATEDTAFVDVIVIAEKYIDSVKIADLIRESLERKRGVFAGLKIVDIRLVNSDEDGEDVFVQGLSFEIIIEKN